MNIQVTDSALKWFKEDVQLSDGDMVKFYVRIYGTSPIQENYSLGFDIDKDIKEDSVSTEKDGITFYVYEEDLWFFKNKNLLVDFDAENDEVVYDYID